LAAAETQTMQTTEDHWSRWLLALWPWIVGRLRDWTPTTQRHWATALQHTPRGDEGWTALIPMVWQAGRTASAPVPPRGENSHGASVQPPASSPRMEPSSRVFHPPMGPRGRPLTPTEQAHALRLAEQTAGAYATEWATGFRERLRVTVAQAVRDGWTPNRLAAELAHQWQLAGVRWHRIAVTELSTAYHHGLLRAVTPGQWGYIAPIRDAKVCTACHRLLEGRHFRLYPTAPRVPTSDDWQHALWPGKTNVGRKPSEWVPTVPLHPQCRHLVTVVKGGRDHAPHRRSESA